MSEKPEANNVVPYILHVYLQILMLQYRYVIFQQLIEQYFIGLD